MHTLMSTGYSYPESALSKTGSHSKHIKAKAEITWGNMMTQPDHLPKFLYQYLFR